MWTKIQDWFARSAVTLIMYGACAGCGIAAVATVTPVWFAGMVAGLVGAAIAQAFNRAKNANQK